MSSLRELNDSRSSGAPSPRTSVQGQQNGGSNMTAGTIGGGPTTNSGPSQNILDLRAGGDATNSSGQAPVSIPPVVDHYDEKYGVLTII